MAGETLLSTRARRWRDWVFFTLAAVLPALAIGWLGLRALRGEEDATRREVDFALQTAAEKTTRRAQDEVEEATVRLGELTPTGDSEDFASALPALVPPFADGVFLADDGSVLVPAPPAKSRDDAGRDPAPAHCRDLATSLARVKAHHPEDMERFLTDCEESRTPTGRWAWPLFALRASSDTDPQRFAAWVDEHSASMRRSERTATIQDLRGSPWLPDALRDSVIRALASDPTRHEAVAQTLRREAAAAALRKGPDQTGSIRWRAGASWGVLRQLPDRKLAGFVIHAPSVGAALGRGWPTLPETYRASLSVRERRPSEDLVHLAHLAPDLALRVALADPSFPERQAERGRLVLMAVGAGATVLAFAVAALLFARMRAARRLSELRTGFVSTVSHELRTPIASVRMLAELLEQGRVEAEERQEVHGALAREAKRLGDTVDRLLGFSRMAAGRYVIQRREASIVDAVASSIDTFEERHPDLPRVDRALPVRLVGSVDAGQLQLAVDNLLGNALKYAPRGTPYRVTVREEDGSVVIEVADHGPGIPRRDRKRVFNPFERGDDRLSSAVDGSGIGLSLVRHVAQAHGGAAEVDTQPGGGARVRIRFPRKAP